MEVSLETISKVRHAFSILPCVSIDIRIGVLVRTGVFGFQNELPMVSGSSETPGKNLGGTPGEISTVIPGKNPRCPG